MKVDGQDIYSPSLRLCSGQASILQGFLPQKMVSSGQEVILGGKRDPGFGPVVIFGSGRAASTWRCSTTWPSAWLPSPGKTLRR